MRGLHHAGHLGNLPADHWVLHEGLAEGLALVGELQGLFEADTAEAVGHGTDREALMVEVLHDVLEALVLLAEQVLLRHLDVVEGDVRGAGGPHTGALHLARREAGHAAFDEEEADATHARASGAAGDSEVFGEDAVRDPLLLAVQDVMVALQLGRGAEVGDIAARGRLRDAEARCGLALETPGDHTLPDLLGGVVVDWGQADGGAPGDAPEEATRARPRDLVVHDELVEVVGLEAPGALPDELLRPRPAQAERQGSLLARLQVDLLRDCPGLIPLVHVPHDVLLHKVAEVLAELPVGVVVVRRIVRLVP
mmetsp:Transcript_783/g.2637  ORF Transcript_783/g.2637 Transcript_783/m.2637 type:complete len:310 (-) Transcript_783:135-1064(-)